MSNYAASIKDFCDMLRLWHKRQGHLATTLSISSSLSESMRDVNQTRQKISSNNWDCKTIGDCLRIAMENKNLNLQRVDTEGDCEKLKNCSFEEIDK